MELLVAVVMSSCVAVYSTGTLTCNYLTEMSTLSIWNIISEKCYPKFLRKKILWKGYHFYTMDKIS
jgi:hypothetical protein